jgi:zinc and cadmium transporter
MLILWITFFSLLGSVGALATAAAFLFLRKKIQKVIIPCLVSYASGTLLAAAMLGLLPQALTNTANLSILSTVLVGIVIFFILEKLVIWRHCHDVNCEIHGIAGPMILMGDLFHNATDGLVIAASFLSSISMGLAAGISIIAHEIPQEISDFAILLHSGYPKRKALLYNLLSSLSTLPAAIMAYYALEIIRSVIPYVMAFSAASFLYIALTDLYPQLHQKMEFGSAIQQFFMILAGIGTMILLLQFHLN